MTQIRDSFWFKQMMDLEWVRCCPGYLRHPDMEYYVRQEWARRRADFKYHLRNGRTTTKPVVTRAAAGSSSSDKSRRINSCTIHVKKVSHDRTVRKASREGRKKERRTRKAITTRADKEGCSVNEVEGASKEAAGSAALQETTCWDQGWEEGECMGESPPRGVGGIWEEIHRVREGDGRVQQGDGAEA